MAFMQHVRHQRVQRLLTETPESFTDHLSDHSKTRRVIVDALRAGRHYLTNEEARSVLSDYNICAIDTLFCDDVDEVLGAFSVERRSMDITWCTSRPAIHSSPTVLIRNAITAPCPN